MSQDPAMYRVIGPPDCPIAQSVELLLGLRGVAAERRIGARTRLVVRPDQAMLMLAEGGPAIFDLIGKLDPGQPYMPLDPDLRERHRALMALAFGAMPALDQVIAAQNLRDLDIAVHTLRGMLIRIETALSAVGLSDAPGQPDAALLPLFWRVALLDLRHQAHLGDGLLDWTRRSGRMLRDPRLAIHFDRQAGRRFLDRLIRQGSALACDPRDEDWGGVRAGPVAADRTLDLKKMQIPKANSIHYCISRV